MGNRPKGRGATLLLAAGVASWLLSAGAAQADTNTQASQVRVTGSPSPAEPTTLKTLSFLSLASLNDFGFGYIFGGLATGGALVVANLTTGWGLYHLHEVTWARLLPAGQPQEETTAVRTATFTVVNSARIFVLGLLLTGDALISGGFVVFNAVGDAAAYVVVDEIWARLLPDPHSSHSVP